MFVLRNLKKNNSILQQQNDHNTHLRKIFRNLRNFPNVNTESWSLAQSIIDPKAIQSPIINKQSAIKKEELNDSGAAVVLPSVECNASTPTFNLAAYINKSTTLQLFVKLGVDLHHIERRKGLAEFMLRLNFERDVQPYLRFLHDQSVPAEILGELITKNPLIFKEDLDDLQTRVNYLEAKKFTQTQRQRIMTLNAHWLMFSTRRIDRRLGYFQQEFKLSGDDIRFLATKQPRLITYNLEHIRKSTFCVREEMGFNSEELRCLLLNKPKLWMLQSDEVIERFSYAHNEMGLSHSMLIQFAEVLTSRRFRLRERHEFLKILGRAQYDPDKDLYISPRSVVEGNNFQFVRHVAKSDLKTFELFLKTK